MNGQISGENMFIMAPVRENSEAVDGDNVDEVGMTTTVYHLDKEEGVYVLSSQLQINGERPHLKRSSNRGEHELNLEAKFLSLTV